jgi:hypothetical protein
VKPPPASIPSTGSFNDAVRYNPAGPVMVVAAIVVLIRPGGRVVDWPLARCAHAAPDSDPGVDRHSK